MNTCKIIDFSNYSSVVSIDSLILDFRNELEVFQKAQGTIDNYSIFLNRFIKDNNFQNIDQFVELEKYDFYVNFISDLQNSNLKNSTINNRLDMLSVFVNFLIRKEILKVNMIKHIPKLPEPTKQVGYLENEQVQELLSAMKSRVDIPHKRHIDEINAFREYAMVALMVTLGLRVSECCDILIEDIDMDKGIVGIRGKGFKGQVSRVLDIPTSIMSLLQQWERERVTIDVDCNSQEYFFISALTKKHVRRAGMEKRLKLVGEEIGIDMLYPHLLRHSFATNNIHDKELTVYEASEILGHSSIKTTERFYVSQDRKALSKTKDSGKQYNF